LFNNVSFTSLFRQYLGGYRYSRLPISTPSMSMSMSYFSYIKRRKAVYLALAVVILLFIVFPYYLFPHHHQSGSESSGKSICPITPPKKVYIPTNHSRFDWNKVPTKYPVKDLLGISASEPLPLPQIQHKFPNPTTQALATRNFRQAQVKAVFQKCWDSYKSKAWLKDELAPVSGTSKNTFGGWGATLVDSLDTLYIMDLHDEFETAVAAAVDIDFGPETSSLDKINIFETTIRYLGGFLAAYDLTTCQDSRLLDKAVEVG